MAKVCSSLHSADSRNHCTSENSEEVLSVSLIRLLLSRKESHMRFEFPAAVPEIPVRSIPVAAEYYRNNLGIGLDWGGGDMGVAGIGRGASRMFLANQHGRKQHGNGRTSRDLAESEEQGRSGCALSRMERKQRQIVYPHLSRSGAYTSSRRQIWMAISFGCSMTLPLLDVRRMPNTAMQRRIPCASLS